MKSIYLFLSCFAVTVAVLTAWSKPVVAQNVDPQAAAVLVTAQPSVLAPLVASPQVVAVAEPAAPPKWAADLLVSVQNFPVIGPIVSKAILYVGIVSSILTALVACVLTILSALSGALNLAGLASFVAKIQDFKNGKIMYWLTYLSMFNAKKPDVPVAQAVIAGEEKKAA